MKRNKADIQNENMNAKNNVNKRRNRYRSILIVNKKDILDLEKNLNKKNNNNNNNININNKLNNISNLNKATIMNNNNNIGNNMKGKRKKRNSVIQIMRGKGLGLFLDENENLLNKKQMLNEIKKGKIDLYSKKSNEDKKNNENYVEIRRCEGVNYIVFKFKHDLKTMYKKEKWKLVKCPIVSFCLKKTEQIKENNNNKNKKNKASFDIENVESREIINEIYKRNGNVQKLFNQSKNNEKNNNTNNDREIDNENDYITENKTLIDEIYKRKGVRQQIFNSSLSKTENNKNSMNNKHENSNIKSENYNDSESNNDKSSSCNNNLINKNISSTLYKVDKNNKNLDKNSSKKNNKNSFNSKDNNSYILDKKISSNVNKNRNRNNNISNSNSKHEKDSNYKSLVFDNLIQPYGDDEMKHNQELSEKNRNKTNINSNKDIYSNNNNKSFKNLKNNNINNYKDSYNKNKSLRNIRNFNKISDYIKKNNTINRRKANIIGDNDEFYNKTFYSNVNIKKANLSYMRKKKPNNDEYMITDGNKKTINKVKYEKAKIRKFHPDKSNDDDDLKESLHNNNHKSNKHNSIYNSEDKYITHKKLHHSHSKTKKNSSKMSKDKKKSHNNLKKKIKNNSQENINKLYVYENNPSLSSTNIFSNNTKINKVTKNENKNKNGIINSNNTLEQSYYFKTPNQNIHNSQKRRIKETNDNKEVKKIPKKLHIYNSQEKLQKNRDFDTAYKTIHNSTKKISQKNIYYKNNIDINDQSNEIIKLKRVYEVDPMDAIKSKFKKKLIEINDELLDAIHYYNGPIDISCISSKNYQEAVEELNEKLNKKGIKCQRYENNYFKVSNGKKSFSVEIVKIRNNMLYFLFLKNK
jgi:hypothetical protein